MITKMNALWYMYVATSHELCRTTMTLKLVVFGYVRSQFHDVSQDDRQAICQTIMFYVIAPQLAYHRSAGRVRDLGLKTSCPTVCEAALVRGVGAGAGAVSIIVYKKVCLNISTTLAIPTQQNTAVATLVRPEASAIENSEDRMQTAYRQRDGQHLHSESVHVLTVLLMALVSVVLVALFVLKKLRRVPDDCPCLGLAL